MAGTGHAHLREDALLSVRDLVVEYHLRSGSTVHAVSGISLDVLRGETVGLVGESGCGKSTTGRAILRHTNPTSGAVLFDGVDLAALRGAELRQIRVRLQMIFQDPISSLDPRRPVEELIGEGLLIWKRGSNAERHAKVKEMLDAVGLDYDPRAKRRRHEFSGGQCQRISIARALVLDPEIVICDEPVSALDVSVQAQILNLLRKMRDRYDLTMLFISHDLAVVKHICDRVAVMYLGKLCEVADPEAIYERPMHPYTTELLSSIPVPDPATRRERTVELERSAVEAPSPLDPPSGCRYRSRCPNAGERCVDEEPLIRELAQGHFVACHFPNNVHGVESASAPSLTVAER